MDEGFHPLKSFIKAALKANNLLSRPGFKSRILFQFIAILAINNNLWSLLKNQEENAFDSRI